jgi:hypothetical protein
MDESKAKNLQTQFVSPASFSSMIARNTDGLTDKHATYTNRQTQSIQTCIKTLIYYFTSLLLYYRCVPRVPVISFCLTATRRLLGTNIRRLALVFLTNTNRHIGN